MTNTIRWPSAARRTRMIFVCSQIDAAAFFPATRPPDADARAKTFTLLVSGGQHAAVNSRTTSPRQPRASSRRWICCGVTTITAALPSVLGRGLSVSRAPPKSRLQPIRVREVGQLRTGRDAARRPCAWARQRTPAINPLSPRISQRASYRMNTLGPQVEPCIPFCAGHQHIVQIRYVSRAERRWCRQLRHLREFAGGKTGACIDIVLTSDSGPCSADVHKAWGRWAEGGNPAPLLSVSPASIRCLAHKTASKRRAN
jgi:hypothetical protein